jgi:hypothetical protein
MRRHLHQIGLALALCALLITLLPPPISGATSPSAVRVTSFTLSKTEAAKGEQVVARWSFTGRARKVSLSTASGDGMLLPYTWSADPGQVNRGALTFTVPYSLYTLSPMLVALNVDGQLLNTATLLITCDNAWFFSPRPERCPSMPIKPSWAAAQDFEHGRMIWIQERGHVLVFYNPDVASTQAGRWETFEDKFREGDPESDPALTSPAGKLQPRRGFGRVWRTQARVRDVLGWALAPERGYTACLGGGFGGWKSFVSYLNDADNRIMELKTYYMPTTWSMVAPTATLTLTSTQGVAPSVTFKGCGSQ